MSTCCTRRVISGSSSTRRMRGIAASAMHRRLPRTESASADLLPAGLPPPCVPQPAQPPVQSELAVAEVLQHSVQQQNEHLPPTGEWQQPALQPVGYAIPKTPGSYQHGQHIHQHAVAEGSQQKRQQVVVADELLTQDVLHEYEKQKEKIPGDLHQRPVILEQPEGGQRKPADAPKLGLAQHGAVIVQRFPETAIPPSPLHAERPEGLRHLGPGYRVGKKRDPAVMRFIEQEPMQAYDDLHVLTHRPPPASDILVDESMPQVRREISAGPDHGLLLEDREHTTQDQDRVYPIEAGSRDGEGPEVFHHLKSSEGPGRQSHVDHVAVTYRAAVRDGHLASDRDHPRILLNDSHQLLQGSLIQNGVGME